MLGCSYSYTLIEGFGKTARDIVVEEGKTLGLQLSRSAQAAGDWRTTRGGGYFCAGVNAGIAGHRARLGLIDDYLGSEKDADSKIIREDNWKWYWNDFIPRLLPNAWQIIIANRRHEDDMVGRLLNDEAKNWEVVSLPMLAEDNDPLGRFRGERLWEGWFTAEQVRLAQKLPRTWAGLYQQRPAPEEGNFFKADTITTYDSPSKVPPDLRIYAVSDWALRRGKTNDFTFHGIGGLDTTGRLWILTWFWEQVDTLEATNKMFEMAVQHEPAVWWQGKENITGSVGPFIYDKMKTDRVYFNIEELKETQDKEAKAQSFKAMMAAGQVMFPSFHPQWGELLNQILTFPAGIHDDAVDALAKFGMGLNGMVRSTKKKVDWDGVVPDQRLTVAWVLDSHKRREREATLQDN